MYNEGNLSCRELGWFDAFLSVLLVLLYVASRTLFYNDLGSVSSFSILNDFFAYIVFTFLPYLLGRVALFWFFRRYKLDGGLTYIVNWCAGSLLLYVVSLLLYFAGIFSPELIILFIFAMLYFSLLYFFTHYFGGFLPTGTARGLASLLKRGSEYVVLLAAVLYVGFIVREKSPYPLHPGWDFFRDMFIAGRIAFYGEFMPLTSMYAEHAGVSVGLTFFDLLLSVACLWVNSSFVGVFWLSPFVIPFVLAVCMYESRKFWGEEYARIFLLASFVSLWIVESKLPIGFIKFTDDRFLLPLFFYMYSYYNGSGVRFSRKALLPVFVFIFVSCLFHVAGFVFLLLFAADYAIKLIEKKNPYALFSLLLFFVSIIVYGYFTGENLLTKLWPNTVSFPGSVVAGNTSYQFRRLVDWYSQPILILCVAGLFIVFLMERYRPFRSMGFLTVTLLFLFLLPAGGANRLALFVHLFAPFLIAVFIDSVSNASGLLWERGLKLSRTWTVKLKSMVYLVIIFIVLLYLASSPLCAVSLWSEKSIIKYPLSSYSTYELRAGIWMRENLPKDAVIVSEPVLMKILGGISFRESFGTGYVRYFNLTSRIRDVIVSMNSPRNCSYVYNALHINKSRRVYVVLSCRVFMWLRKKRPDKFFMWWPCDSVIGHLNVSTCFKEVYADEGGKLYIYEVKLGDH